VGEENYEVRYRISYVIFSDATVSMPLAFLGLDLGQQRKITVNGAAIGSRRIADNFPAMPFMRKREGRTYIRYTENDELSVDPGDVVYFEAPLRQGENEIVVECTGALGFNRFGFVKDYTLTYSLYPSRFWRSFAPLP
jgi:hypothetical protein